MNTPDSVCLAVEESLSAWLDGELAPAAAAEAFEHAFGCPSCRAFFVAAKRLQVLAPELGSRSEPTPARRARRPWAALRVHPYLRAAALVVLGLGGGWMLARLPPTPSDGPTVATAGPMTEQRFVELASELMTAEPKYQRTMLQVLRLVPALETGEGLDAPDDSRYVRAEIEEPRTAQGAV